MTIEAEIRRLTASDGYELAWRLYAPAQGRPRGVATYLHGIQSHGGWYEASSRHLAEAGLAVCFADRRGSGMNSRDRGHTPSWERLAADVTEMEESVRGELDARELPLHMIGVSWGGKLAAALAAMHHGRYASLVLMCPGICPQRDVSRGEKVAIAKAVLGGREMTMFPIPLAAADLFTATPRWLEFLRGDRLALHEATARLLFESRRLDGFVAEAAEWIQTPSLLMLAGQDRIIDNAATQQWFARVGGPRKCVRTYGAAHHTLEFEDDPSRVFADLATWLAGESEAEA